MIRVLVADDEPLARRRIKTLLSEAPDMAVIAEASDGEMAASQIRKLRPDAVFLDIRMPLLDGFGVLDAVAPEARPITVFLTAYDQFAIQAFNVAAADYLLKPFDDLRFADTLTRIRQRLMGRDRLPESEPLCLISLNHGRKTLIPIDRIEWIAAAGDYAEIHVKGEVHLVEETLAALSRYLADKGFVRIHRGVIVRMRCIGGITPAGRGDAVITLLNGKKLRLSRSYRHGFMAKLSSRSVLPNA